MNKARLSANGVQQATAKKSLSGMPITESVGNGFFTVNEQWIVLTWNNSAEKLLGVAAADILGKNLWEEFAAIIPLNFYVVYHKAFLNDIPIHFREYWAEMGAWYDVITYHSGNTLSVSFKNTNHSIYPDHPAPPVQHLKILNELYKYVTEVTNDCLWEWDLKNRQIFWIDGSHKRIFGYDIENALVPQSFWESRIHPADKDRILEKLNYFIASHSLEWEIEYRFRKADGEYAYVRDRGHVMPNSERTGARMIGATQDITKKKLTEIKLLRSETKLSLIARKTIHAILITDPDEKITWANAAFTKITGYELKEVIGRKPSFLQGENTDASTVDYLRQKISAHQPFDCNILNYGKNGRPFWSHLQGQAILDENGNCDSYFSMSADITEKVERENAIKAEKESRQKEVNRAVLIAQEKERAHFGREMHDNLNQILGAAKLYIELAKNEKSHQAESLDKATSYITDVIMEIRKISKALVPPVLMMGLADSIKILRDDLTMALPLKIEFIAENINEDLLSEHLQFDCFRIVQEQLNNIVKHAEATRVSIRLHQTKTRLTLQISDNGKGCDMKKQVKGVGLININTRAELYGGFATVVSKPGHGFGLETVFHLQNNNL